MLKITFDRKGARALKFGYGSNIDAFINSILMKMDFDSLIVEKKISALVHEQQMDSKNILYNFNFAQQQQQKKQANYSLYYFVEKI